MVEWRKEDHYKYALRMQIIAGRQKWNLENNKTFW
jgi:hypothetical protein